MTISRALQKIAGALLPVVVVLACSASPALAESSWWRIESGSRPSNLAPGGTGVLAVTVENVGDALADASKTPVVIDDSLSAGLRATGAPTAANLNVNALGAVPCVLEEAGARVSCTYSGTESEQPLGEQKLGGLPPFQQIEVRIPVVVQAGAVVCEPHSRACEQNVVSVSGGGAPPARVSRPIVVNAQAPVFGVESYGFTPESEGGRGDTQAGSHPFQVGFDLTLNQGAQEGEGFNGANVHTAGLELAKDLRFKLPPGFVGDPSAIPTCPIAEFLHNTHATPYHDECPADTAVGVITLTYYLPHSLGYVSEDLPVFNLEPSVGEPARFGFFIAIAEYGVYIDTAVRTGEDYGVTSTSTNISQEVEFISAKATLWGVPGDSRHNDQRGWGCLAAGRGEFGGTCGGVENGSHPPPFLDLPTSCTGSLQTSVEADSWRDAGHFESFPSEPVMGLDGCNQLQFVPEIKVTPDGTEASKPTGLTVDVHVPQEGQLNGEGNAQSNIKDIEVTLPNGVTLNPSAADGLQACSGNTGSALGGRLGVPGNQIGYKGSVELNPEYEHGNETPQFTPYVPESTDALANGYEERLKPGENFCPDASKVATVKIKTPLLPNPVLGAVYLASPQNFEVFPPENPFGVHVVQYLVAEDPVSGSLVKLPGRVELGGEPGASPELAPGQIRSFFEDNPQLPFEDAEVSFFGGERAPLATPEHCGTYTTQAVYTPWDGEAPVTSYSSFQITSGPNGSACPGSSLPFTPTSTGGALNLNAGAFSPFTTTLSRAAGEQDLQSAEVKLPPGLSGILSGVELCREPQADQGTCGPNSQIGETTVSVGVGGEPFTVTGGKVYLTGPYNGTSECATPGTGGCGSFGLSVVNPAKAGPFELQQGRPVVVRAKIEVDPYTAALTVTSNSPGTPYAIPTIIEGFPLQIEHVNITTTRSDFQFNPTNCAKMQVEANLHSTEGASDLVKIPFQVTNCASLKFTPKFTVSTSSTDNFNGNGASLISKVTEPSEPQGSQANITRFKVELPLALPSRLTTLQKACLAKVFEANPAACPPASDIGHAVVHTHLLPVPLEGPAIFVSHGNEAFPSLTMVLQGYGVTVDLVGSTFISHKGITSTTFKTVPDQPFNTFELTLPEGKYSALAATTDVCKPTTTKTVKKKVTVKRHGKRVKVTKKVSEKVAAPLIMPTEIVAQNGAEIHENTKISVTGCKKAKPAKKKTKSKSKKGKKGKKK